MEEQIRLILELPAGWSGVCPCSARGIANAVAGEANRPVGSCSTAGRSSRFARFAFSCVSWLWSLEEARVGCCKQPTAVAHGRYREIRSARFSSCRQNRPPPAQSCRSGKRLTSSRRCLLRPIFTLPQLSRSSNVRGEGLFLADLDARACVPGQTRRGPRRLRAQHPDDDGRAAND